MNYRKLENAEVIRRFSRAFDEDYFLMKYQKTVVAGEGEIYLLLKVVGTISIDEALAESMEKAQSSEQTVKE
jgi:hypothetical protein